MASFELIIMHKIIVFLPVMPIGLYNHAHLKWETAIEAQKET